MFPPEAVSTTDRKPIDLPPSRGEPCHTPVLNRYSFYTATKANLAGDSLWARLGVATLWPAMVDTATSMSQPHEPSYVSNLR